MSPAELQQDTRLPATLHDIGMGTIAKLQNDLPVIAARLGQIGTVVAPALMDDRAVAPAGLRQPPQHGYARSGGYRHRI